MEITKELIKKIEYALTFVGKTVYASELNFEGESLPSIINGVLIEEGWDSKTGGKKYEIFLTDDDNDLAHWINLEDFNETWFLTKKELKEYWKHRVF